MSSRPVAAFLATAAVLLASCSVPGLDSATEIESPTAVVRSTGQSDSSLELFDQSPREWVSYANAVVSFEVTDERMGPRQQFDNGLVVAPRVLTLEILDVLWLSPYYSKNLPDQIEILGTAYTFAANGEQPSVEMKDAPKVVGGQYIDALGYQPANDSWFTFSTASPDANDFAIRQGTLTELRLSTDQLIAALVTAKPYVGVEVTISDPIARKFAFIEQDLRSNPPEPEPTPDTTIDRPPLSELVKLDPDPIHPDVQALIDAEEN